MLDPKLEQSFQRVASELLHAPHGRTLVREYIEATVTMSESEREWLDAFWERELGQEPTEPHELSEEAQKLLEHSDRGLAQVMVFFKKLRNLRSQSGEY